MTAVVTTPPRRSTMTLMDAHGPELDLSRPMTGQTRLIPEASLMRIITGLAKSLEQRAPIEIAEQAANYIVNCFGGKAHKDQINTIAEILSRYPPGIVEKATRQLVEESRYPPRPSDVKAVCGDLAAERRLKIKAAERQLREHQRRRKEEKIRSEIMSPEEAKEKWAEFKTSYDKRRQDRAASERKPSEKAPWMARVHDMINPGKQEKTT